MGNEKRRHPRKAGRGDLHIRNSSDASAYAVSLKDVSRGGAFVRSSTPPALGRAICFTILDEYGLEMAMGQATVMRVVANDAKNSSGFAIQFETELDPALLDYLSALRMDNAI